ncbi:hypothetical protein WH693_00265 [Klebsiella pneumoniae]
MKSCSPEVMADETNPSRITCTGSSDTGDNGHYALTTKTYVDRRADRRRGVRQLRL